MKIYRLVGEDGLPMFSSTKGDLPAGSVEVDRMPTAFEDFVDGAWVYNARAHADQIAGPDHITQAHLAKYTEALLIKSGVDLKVGLLVAEALQHKTPIQALADEVLAKRAGFFAVERGRQAAQVKGKIA